MSDLKPEGQVLVLHIFAVNSRNCPECDSPPSEHEVRNYNIYFSDGDIHCTRCGAFVRWYDAG